MLLGSDAELAALRALLAQRRSRPGQLGLAVADTLGFPSVDATLVGLAETERLVVLDKL